MSHQENGGGPTLTIRDIKKQSVNFVLDGVDLALVCFMSVLECT